MPTRQVDVTIAGKNTAGAAFKAAGTDVDAFANRVQRMLNPLHLLKGVLAGLGIASFGAILRKATEAAIDHERGLGRNVAQLDRLKSAWDFVLVRLGQAVLGMDQAGTRTNTFTEALVGLGDWIETNKGNIAEVAGTVLSLAEGLGKVATVLKVAFTNNPAVARSGLASLLGVADSSGHGSSRTFGGGFEDFQKEQERKRQLDLERKELEAMRAGMKADSDRMAKEREGFGDIRGSTKAGGYVGFGTLGGFDYDHALGQGPTLKAITALPPVLEAGTKNAKEMGLALGEVGETLKSIGEETVMGFASAWADATSAIVTGSEKAGTAIAKAFRRATGQALMAEGQKWLLEAGAIAVQGLYNPVDWWRAARLALYGTTAIATGAAFAGGGGGGGYGSLGSAGFSQQSGEVGKGGDITIILQGGRVLDMGDPQVADAFANAWKEATGRRLIIIPGA